MSQHTKTPWVTEQIDADSVYIMPSPDNEQRRRPITEIVTGWYGDSGDYIKDAENAANAAFIVRAVNSHAELLEALEAAQIALAGFEDGNNCAWLARNKAIAAIAKAKGAA